ncbi:GH3 auxin-responsive promoter family protein [Mesorhizobium sp. NZP2077]|uniref:GH3 family domain-containing protein n=1 Tax=Mesorhizobium sp. NZP2077 TaxID=2483404 RepID=UPI00155427B7|nr:GH3 auxin-responsive promoter family protein [Mesorhizobium sp. NZP2077]QKC82648.1 GH3 auxin-responsive promoter [Mesorhizobium sp. NZP2077]QKD16146.1 GH3 auxin-responsive promoter family protein [Mesorhizobium sp. NZP2077]
MVAEAWAQIAGATAAAEAVFQSRLDSVEATQRAVLRRLVNANAATAFGADQGFAGVTSAETFRDLVPICDYEMVSPYIERVVSGGDNVLTAEPVRFLEQTGGSSGGSKFIPYTDTGLQAFTDCLYPWLANLIRRRPGIRRGRSYFALSPVGRGANERVGAHRLGSPVPFAYFGALRDSLIELSAVPMHLRLLTDFANWQRQTCLHLLAAEDLALIWVWSPTYLTEILRAMQRDGGSLLAELAEKLRATQTADAVRSRIAVLERALGNSQLSEIWPRLDTISCWTDASSSGFAAALQAQFPHVFIQSKGLMSTEAAVSFPYGDGPGCILASQSGFFEFVDEGGACLFASQLEAGRIYRLIVTTGSGLYRYDTQDMIEVTGYSGDTPRLRFHGRAGMASDLCGEKLTEAFVARCLAEIGLDHRTYALLVAVAAPHPHYRLFVEAGQGRTVDAFDESLDHALKANPQYEYARRIGQLEPLRAKGVDDLYGRLKRHRTAGGTSIAGMKAPILLGRSDAALLAALEADQGEI